MVYDNIVPKYAPQKGNGIIYLYEISNGLQYVGQTIRSMRIRHTQHLTGKCPFDDFLRTHDFKLSILEEVPEDMLVERETVNILKYNTLYPIGLNYILGVQNTSEFMKQYWKEHPVPFKGKKHTEKTKKQLSLIAKQRWENKTDEEKEDFAKIRKGIIPKNTQKVICLETGVIYDCIKDIKKDGFRSPSCVSRCCTAYHNKQYGGRQTYMDKHWIYLKDYDQTSTYDDIINEIESKRLYVCRRGVRIVCVETGETFSSYLEVAKKYNIYPQTLRYVIKKKKENIFMNKHWIVLNND